MKSAILIKTTNDLPLVIIVNNFSKQNVVSVLSEILRILPKDFEQLVANTNGGVYAITKDTDFNISSSTYPINEKKYKKVFDVEYVNIFETKTN